jgi:hypothetical protein
VAWHIPSVVVAQFPNGNSILVDGDQRDHLRIIASQVPPATKVEGLSVSSLDEGWEFRRDGETHWKPVRVPATFESHEGVLFDGVGWYRRTWKRMELDVSTQHLQALVRFQGSATKTKVWCNGELVAEHLGGWTPFVCDISKFLFKQFSENETSRDADSDDLPIVESSTEKALNDSVELLVHVDELVGHNSQGFLPVFAPHFGGLWKPVELLIRYPVGIDAERVHVWGDLESSMLNYDVPLRCYDLPAIRNFLDARKTYFVRIEHAPAPKRAVDPGDSDTATEPAHRVWAQTVRMLTPAELNRLLDEGVCALSGSIHVPEPIVWAPESPGLYDLRISIREGALDESVVVDGNDPAELHWFHTKAAFRSFRADGDQLFLNGKPLAIRGVLNWGYAPPSTAPSLDPNHWRAELQLVKDYGFNLVKFCLWIPPKGYLEMADEMGVLVWMEYPTWHSKWTKDQLPTLSREFDEFFFYDRNHPSVILRSLTCETGPSADIEVIRALYDQCHDRIPNSVVEDDSSWIQWNRVNDFYDDHPYGNNHTWSATLDSLKRYIADHGKKPLVLGEAIAADTWVVPNSLDSQIGNSPTELLQNVKRGDLEQAFWLPLAYRSNQEWAEARTRDMGGEAVTRLEADSKRYAMLMRKYQIESYRNQIPFGGYVVSVIRDFPFAAMGLLDYRGMPKWENDVWNWHGAHMFVVKTPGDRRSFWADAPFQGKIFLEGSFGVPARRTEGDGLASTPKGTPPLDLLLRQTWTCGDRVIQFIRTLDVSAFERVDPTASGDSRVEDARWRLKPFDVISRFDDSDTAVVSDLRNSSECWNLEIRLMDGDTTLCQNNWDFWRLPKPSKLSDEDRGRISLSIQGNCSTAVRKALEFVDSELGLQSELGINVVEERSAVHERAGIAIQIASRFDRELVDFLEQGGRVLMLPDGQSGSFPLTDHWFLRGGPIVNSESSWNQRHPMVRDLQHFDLAGRVVPDVAWLDEMTPMVMLWDNHDIASVKTHGLVFACRFGKGLLLVDALQHGDAANAAGMTMLADDLRWLVEQGMVESDHTSKKSRIAEMEPESIRSIRDKLQEKVISLIDLDWRFLPDPKNEGIERGWNKLELETSESADWKEIRIGKHWDAQGYGGLDGWAWYRVDIPIPVDWREGALYLWVDGADDYIEVFADGELIGSSGDREARETAFEQRSSFKLADRGPEREVVTIAIRVEDWQGAGGLFRPIWLSNIDRRDRRERLK